MMRAQHPDARAATLIMIAMCVEMCVSANFLTYIGLPYVTEGGAYILKLHPGTDLLIISCSLLMFTGPSTFFLYMPSSLRTYAISLFICILFSLTFTGTDNLIVFLDTFLPAGLAAILIGAMTPGKLLKLRSLMQCLFTLNACLALVETCTKTLFIPLYLNNELYNPSLSDFRPTALYDHPLTGALMTMMGLALAPSSGTRKRIYLALMWAAMLAFGGRIAIATSVTTLLFTKGVPIASKAFSWDNSARQKLFLAVAGLLFAVPIVVLIGWSGLADRLLSHLYWDASAQVRLQQWDILTYIDAPQLCFGTPRRELLKDLNALRLTSGVGVLENFWLLMFVNLGMFGFPAFLIAIGSICAWCWKVSGPKGRMLLISVLIVASTSNSLGRKSTVLVCLVASVACSDFQPLPIRRRALSGALARRMEMA